MEIEGTGRETEEEAERMANDQGRISKDEFLRLLVDQLNDRNPPDALRGRALAARVAEFTSIEQLLSILQALAADGEFDSLLAHGINSGVASGLIGMTIEAEAAALVRDDSGATAVILDLASAAVDLEVTILDRNETVLTRINPGSLGAGRHRILWDGRDHNGSTVPKEIYRVEITATDSDGDPIDVSTFTSGRVDRVTFGQDGIMLWLGSLALPLGSVRSLTSD